MSKLKITVNPVGPIPPFHDWVRPRTQITRITKDRNTYLKLGEKIGKKGILEKIIKRRKLNLREQNGPLREKEGTRTYPLNHITTQEVHSLPIQIY